MRKMIGVILLACSAGAMAQTSWQHAGVSVDICDIVAKRATLAAMQKVKGQPVTPLDAKMLASPYAAMLQWGVNYATTDAIDPKDAYKTTFLKCMDNIDRMGYAMKEGRQLQPHELR